MSEHKHDHECCGGHGHHDHDHECCGGHGHNEGEGCGCGHDHDEHIEYITITLEDGKETSCAILGTFDVESIAGKEYMALLPEGTEEVIIFEFTVDENELTLDAIPDEEFEIVSEEFMSLYGRDNFEDEEFEDEE